MKKLLFLLWLLPAACLAQTDSTQVKPHDVFCRLYAVSGRGLFPKSFFKADFGRDNGIKYLSETDYNRITNKLASINNEIDALDYLSEQGWELFDTNSQMNEPLVYLLRRRVAK